ncbi:MAG: SusC/RagA family TonB-linked outer membrane protein [Bacteroidia bacterium]|nr:SusC/RagA family TonB-linked outer membrane protein [Bacteroidia bacterium]
MTVGLLSIAGLQAQRVASGTVTDATTGEALVGVAVTVKGTTIGIFTNVEGKFRLEVPEGATTLMFSMLGRKTQETPIGDGPISISLEEEDVTADEIVVTALGIKRQERSLGYAVQELKGDNVQLVRQTDVSTALAGKIAGIQVLGQSGVKFGAAAIRVRGVNSLTGGNPLYVVNNTPVDDAGAVNMDDIETLSVLKGPNAVALYGQRAQDGVILITTKQGRQAPGIGVEINSTSIFEDVAVLPVYQNEYGGGYSQEWSTFTYDPDVHPASWAGFDGHNIVEYYADESWGPKLDGTLHRPWYSWYENDPANFGKLVPFSPQANNVREFYETGVQLNNNVAFSKAGEGYRIRLSYTNVNHNGVVPNTFQGRDLVSANMEWELNKNFSVNANINYVDERTRNRPLDEYSNQTIGSFNQWFQRQLDIPNLKNYQNADGTFRSWNILGPGDYDPEDPTAFLKPLYWDNPYTEIYQNTRAERIGRLYGHLTFQYKITRDLRVSLTARRNLYDRDRSSRVASGTLNIDGFSTSNLKKEENNYELIADYSKQFGVLSVDANLGGNIRQNLVESEAMATVGGLTVPGLYNIRASANRPEVSNFFSEKVVRSVFGRVGLGFREMLYLDASLRNDWSSALPIIDNSYLYPSVSASFIFSELMGNTDGWFNFGKIKGSFGQIGSDIDPYNIYITYALGTPFGTNPTQSVPDRLPNADLRPALSSSYEAGIDLRFFQNRIGLDVTLYQRDNLDQIIPIDVARSSGYSTALINAGHIQSRGLEVILRTTPIETSDLRWDLNLNFARNTSRVLELAEGLTNYQLGASWRGITVNAKVGEEWGTLNGRRIVIDSASGKRVVNSSGFYQFELNKDLGGTLPKFTGGAYTSLTYKGIDFGASLDYQIGGNFFSVTRMFNAYSGLADFTAGNNELGNPRRDPVADGGGVLLDDAVLAGGEPNNIRVETQDLYEGALFALHDYWIYDASYVKLREVRVGYVFNRSMLGGLPIQTLGISIIARNPALLFTNVKGVDPSELEYWWTEGGQHPGLRSLGFNLRVGF